MAADHPSDPILKTGPATLQHALARYLITEQVRLRENWSCRNGSHTHTLDGLGAAFRWVREVRIHRKYLAHGHSRRLLELA